MDYLYHYTNIEALALILKNKTIRFSSLDKMDDLQEKETRDLKNVGQFVYISSWTDNPVESIPMWNMYASLDAGVRIKLRKQPFKFHKNNTSDLINVFKMPVTDNTDNGQTLPTWIPLAEMIKNGFYCSQAANENWGPYKVEYTDEQEKLYPQIVFQEEQNISLALGTLGRYKNSHWEFQKEWRHSLIILPIDIKQNPDKILEVFQQTFYKRINGYEKQPFSFIDMDIDDDAFDDMEITMSPRLSAGNRVIAESLVAMYNPKANLKNSGLTGLM